MGINISADISCNSIWQHQMPSFIAAIKNHKTNKMLHKSSTLTLRINIAAFIGAPVSEVPVTYSPTQSNSLLRQLD